jgi:hypothetical protein
MPTLYSPDGTVPEAVAGYFNEQQIAGGTNATPIVLHVVAHGFQSGDTVGVEGNFGNDGLANGIWTISVTDANHFALNGSVGGSVPSTATGSVIDYSVNPQFVCPSDTDASDASSVNPMLQGMANIIPYSYKRFGQYSIRRENILSNFLANPNSGYAVETIASASTWQVVSAIPVIPVSVAPAYPTDRLDIEFTSSVLTDSAPGVTTCAFALGVSLNGSLFTPPMYETSQVFEHTESVQIATGLHLRGSFDFPGTGYGPLTYQVAVLAWAPSTSVTYQFLGAYEIRTRLLRRNT